MPFTFNGNSPTNINYNGNPLDRLIYNGVIVWEKAPTEQTVTPTINTPTLTTTTASWNVLNNDGSAAKVEARLVGNSTWDYFDNIAAGTNSGTFSRSGLTPKTTYTIEARAQATGELMSEIIARQFTTSAIYYTVQWWTWDGEPIFSQQVEKGTTVNAYLPSPVRSGFTFTGWNDGSGVAATFPYTVNDNINFVAMHTITYYDVIWKNWDASTLRTDSIQKDTVLNLGNAPTVSRTGWTHTGWSPTLPRTITANTTFTAQYSINSYDVKWYDYEGSPIKTLTVQYGNTVQATDYPADPTFAGYTFTGWSQAAPFYMPANNVNITSNWTVNTYTQTWKNWDGTTLKTLDKTYGSTVAVIDYPTNPTRTGYTFSSWSKAAPYTVFGANTITAQFTINTYTVSWYDKDNVNRSSSTQNYGTYISVAAIDPGAKVGHTFTGWSPSLPHTVTANVNFIPQYSLNYYTQTWNNWDGTQLKTLSKGYGTTVSSGEYPANPTRTGYTFTGWSIGAGYTVYGANTITAQFSVNSYTVRWYDYEGAVIKSKSYTYGSTCASADYPANPSYSCKTFTGWSKAGGFAVYQNWNITSNWSNNTPVAPASCSGSRPFANAMTMTWASSSCATSYTYEYKLSTVSTYTVRSTTGTSSGTITGLTPGTYHIRVKACNGTACSAYRYGSNVTV